MAQLGQYITWISFLIFVVMAILIIPVIRRIKETKPTITFMEAIDPKEPEIKRLVLKAVKYFGRGIGQFVLCFILNLIINSISGNFVW